MRRLALVTVAAATAALAAVPAPADARHPCLVTPTFETCRDMGQDAADMTPYGHVYYTLTHPEDWMQCVRECGPPTS